jgi:Lon protease-like protein
MGNLDVDVWGGAKRGPLRLFPLPGFVMFPHVAHPFHLFEPRYLALAEEALQTDRLIALAMLQPGWENNYELAPPVYPTVCIAHISAHSRTENGTINVILRGVSRATICDELPSDSPFRRVTAERVTSDNSGGKGVLHHRLLERFQAFLLDRGAEREDVQMLANECCDLEHLTDIVTFSMVDAFDQRRAMLEEFDPVSRAEKLLEQLGQPSGRTFPPPFSRN